MCGIIDDSFSAHPSGLIVKISALTLALVLAASVSACRKAPSPEVSASAQTPAQPATPGQPTAQTPAQTPAPPKPMPAQLPDVIARVNGQDVTKADFEMLVRNMELGNGPIPAERRDEILRGALDRLITYTLLSQEAKARNITVPDAEIEQQMNQMRSQFPDEAAFKKALADRSMSLERLRSDARNDMCITKMLDAEAANAPPVTEADVKTFYDSNPDKFTRGETVRASHILIKVDEKADGATRTKARAQIEAVQKRAKAGEDFAKLAQEHSQDGSAAQGGDLNYFTKDQMVPPFANAAFALKPGEVSDVVTTQFGYHVIKVTDHKPAGAVPLEQVSDRVKQFLAQQKKQQQADTFITALKQKSKIEVLV